MLSRELREFAAFTLGGLGFLHELFIAQGERPFLLTAALTLMGFPFVFRTDELLAKRKKSLTDPGQSQDSDHPDIEENPD